MSISSPEMPVQPIRFWQHWREVDQIYHDYPQALMSWSIRSVHPTTSRNAWYAFS
jgi:hypothetical protein